jgi:hypothetical protein
MNIVLGESLTFDFPTHNPITGQVSDADFLPTCQVFENTTDIPILTPAVTKRLGQTGDYRVSFVTSAVNGFEVDKSYNVIVAATVAGITAKARIASFILEAAVIAIAAHFKT